MKNLAVGKCCRGADWVTVEKPLVDSNGRLHLRSCASAHEGAARREQTPAELHAFGSWKLWARKLERSHREKRHEICRTFSLNGYGRCSICGAIVRDDSEGCPGPPVIVDGKEPPPPPPPMTPEEKAYVAWELSLAKEAGHA